MKLYELTEAFQDIQNMLDDGVPQEQLEDTLKGLTEDFEEKGKSILFLMRNLSSDVDSLKAEEAWLKEKRGRTERSIDSLKQYLIINMQASGVASIDNGIIKATLRKPSPCLVLTNEDLIPDEFKKIKVSSTIDKKGLLAALKDGLETEAAEIGQSKISLTIK